MPDRSLSRGMDGPDVVDLQQRLQRIGLPVKGERGKFGPRTEAAIRSFQEQHQLPVTGIVDERSRAVIEALAGEPPIRRDAPPIRPDVGPIRPDVGPIRPDVGPIRPDVGPIRPDMPPIRPDVGPIQPDMPPIHPDQPPIRPDVGPIRPDVGPIRPDVGPIQPDQPPIRPDVPPIHPDQPPATTPTAIVTGTITFESGLPFGGARVRAIEHRLRDDITLADGAADAAGAYRLTYQPVAAPAGGDRPDLVVAVLGEDGQTIASSDIHFDAPPDTVIDVVVPASAGVEPSEFVRVQVALERALAGVPAKDVASADLVYLAGRTGEHPSLVASYAAAARLSDATGVEPSLLYGLLRSDLPNSLPTLLTQGADLHPQAIETAIARNIVPRGTEPDALATLRKATITALLDPPAQGTDAPILGRVAGTAIESRAARQSFLETYLGFDGPPDRFWQHVRETGTLDAKAADRAEFAFQATLLADGHQPLVDQLLTTHEQGEVTSLRDLAGLETPDWVERIRQTGDAEGVGAAGRTPAELAGSMERMLEDAFPTAALAGKARRHEDSPLHDEHALRFLEANPTFDLGAPKLAQRLTGGDVTIPAGIDMSAVETRLGDVQRLYKLEPRFATIDTLMRDGITSASAIARMGKGTFIQAYQASIGRAKSTAVYEAAEHQSSLALAIYARYGASLNAVQAWAAKTLPDQVEGIPNWETLFGSLDLCECEHCRSIFSPAAYMVDTLAFLRRCTNPASGPRTALDALLERRPDIADLKLSCENTNTPLPYLDLVNELLERAVLEGSQPPRPSQPQVQTVGTEAELAAHPQHIHAEVYTTDLAGAVHPWLLPFDLWATEARAYLGNMDVERHRIMEATVGDRTVALRDEAIAGDYLGFTPAERRIVTGQDLMPPRVIREFWGFEAGDAGWLAELASVPTMLRRAGLTYAELLELLDLRFVNPSGAIVVQSPEGSCDVEEMTIAGLDEAALDRLHRFLRLIRRLGWKPTELDRVLAAFGPVDGGGEPAITPAFLVQVSHLARLKALTRVAPATAAQWWAPRLDTHAYGDEASPYDGLFLSKTVTPDPATSPFRLAEPGRDELADPSATVADQVAAVLGALRIDAEALDLIAGALPGAPAPTVATLPLDLPTLTVLQRTASLARALKLPVRDLLGLVALTGIDPFDPAHTENAVLLAEEGARIRTSGFTIADLELQLLQRDRPATSGVADRRIGVVLAELRTGLRKIRDEHVVAPDPSGELTAKQLAFVIGGPDAGRAVGILARTATIAAPLDALPDGLEFEPPISDRLHFDAAAKQLQFLGALTIAERTTLLGLSADVPYTTAVQALYDAPRSFFRERLTFAIPLAELPAGLVFPAALAGRMVFDASSGALRVDGPLSAAERDGLLALSADPAWRAAVTALSQLAFLGADAVATNLLDTDALEPPEKFAWLLERLVPHVRDLLSRGLVKERVAAALTLPGVVVEQLLSRWIHVGGSTEPAMTSLLGLAELDDRPTRESAGEQFDVLVRLLKTARIAVGFKLSPDEIAYAFDIGQGRGWLRFDDLPVARSADPALYLAWTRIADYVALRRRYPLGEPSILDTFEAALAATDGGAETRAAHLALLSTVTGWPGADLGHLTGPSVLDLAFPDDFRDERPLSRLRPMMELVATIGSAAERVSGWATEGVTESQAAEIKQAAKARYDPEQWLEVAKPIRDGLREQQRDALVAFLLADPGRTGDLTLRTPDDLYRRYLVDVEMGACMPTSRIVQVLAAIQLFVQRTLLNLEPGGLINADLAVQWAWMKNYRVWEANRKVFVSPENWIEPELRTDKTPFFRRLEGELMQADVTAEAAEDALRHYLEDLDGVARLEPSGMYHQREETSATQRSIDILHVIARTTTEPRRHYYRQFVDGGRWTPWEPMDVEIDADHVVPMIHNRRLVVYWPQMLEGANDAPPSQKKDPPPSPTKFTDVKLAWTERRKGKWTSKRVSGQSIRLDLTKDWTSLLSLRAQIDASGDLLIGGAIYFFGYGQMPDTFRISGADGSITLTGGPLAAPDAPPPDTFPSFQRFVEHRSIDMGWPAAGDQLTLPYQEMLYGGQRTVTTLDATPGTFELITPHQYRTFASQDTFFFREGGRTFFVQPIAGRTFRGPQVFEGGYAPLAHPEWHEKYFTEIQRDPLWRVPHGDPEDPWIKTSDVFTERSFPAEMGVSSGLSSGPGASGHGAIGRGAVRDLRPLAPLAMDRATSLGSTVLATTPVKLDVGGRQATTIRALSSPTGFASAWGGADAGSAVRPALARMASVGMAAESGAPGDFFAIAQPAVGTAIDVDALDRGAIIGAIGSYSLLVYTQLYRFATFYHPHVRSFMRELNRSGVPGVLQRDLQLHPESFLAGAHETFDFASRYQPKVTVVQRPYPVEDVDFTYGGAYSQYNWELFFHAPLLIASRLMKNQRFADAQRWLHFIFDPTDASADIVPRRFWRTRPFYDNASPKPIEELLKLLDYDGNDPASRALREDLEHQVEEWREHPFDPHLLARLRPAAYQAAVVMKYLDNLIAWGDQLFRRDTMESVAEATQLYVLAANILGERPPRVPQQGTIAPKSFDELKDQLDAFSNAVVALENELPPPDEAKTLARPDAPAPAAALGPTLYFCIPRNDKLLGYWDTVGDRLFKIRHCLNIEGVERQLALFAPPIDPGMLVRATAAGISIDAALNASSAAALPVYRFAVLVQRAHDLCNELKNLGAQLLGALEKRDAEALAMLRAGAEVELLRAVREVRKLQIKDAEASVAALERTNEVAQAREAYYTSRPYTNERENEHIDALNTAHTLQAIAQGMDVLAAGLAVIPIFDIGVSGAFSSPVAKVKIGGRDFANAVGFAKQALAMGSSIATFKATMASIMAGFDRRQDDWRHQADQARKEQKLIDQQIVGADLRRQIAEQELTNHETQIEQSQAVEVVLRDKYTNVELYDYMITQLSQVFFQTYQLTYDTARMAERCLQHEIGDPNATFVDFGYWDSLRKGLLSGERLSYDLQRMERAYLDLHKREYELTKHVSVALTDPIALVRLRTTGECFVDLPEALFDLDHPGHYMRRLKSVSVTIPCVAGPYTSINCTLTLLRNSVRTSSAPEPEYSRTGGEDTRFRDDLGAIQSIVTSSGQNDSGLFETNLRDERYLPFEGAGAISRWRIQLPADFNAFDFDTISDVVLHLRYTAREGGTRLRTAAAETVLAGSAREGARLLSVSSDFGDEWFRFSRPPVEGATTRTLRIDLNAARFPFRVRDRTVGITRVDILVALVDGTNLPSPIPLTISAEEDGAAQPPITLKKSPLLGQVPYATIGFGEGEEQPLGPWSLTVPEPAWSGLAVEDVLLIAYFRATE